MIKLKDYSFFYKNGKGIKNITFNFEKGTAYALIGPNGSGKTTLINSITGHYIGHGYISVCNKVKHDEFLINLSTSNKGLETSQNKSIILDFLTRNYAIDDDLDKEYLSDILKEFKINIFDTIKSLSKGEEILLYVIVALARNVDFYIFDEPFAGIDQIYRKRVLELIIEKVSLNKTVILSSHDIDNIDTFMDEYIFLKNGNLISNIKQDNITSLKEEYFKIYQEDDNDAD